MSMIVYGPQGCGKSRHAERLRKHFHLHKVVEADFDSVYDQLSTHASRVRFKLGSTLYLTNEPPPPGLEFRRIMSFEEAMQEMRRAPSPHRSAARAANKGPSKSKGAGA